MHEADLALGFGHGRDRGLVGHACGIFIAEELHIAAEWNGETFQRVS